MFGRTRRLHRALGSVLLMAAVEVPAQETTNRQAEVESATNRAVRAEDRGRLQEFLLAEDLWSAGRDAAAARLGRGLWFYWVSSARTAIRSDVRGLVFLDQPVAEVVVRFSSNGVDQVNLSFFNRGDVGEIAVDDFRRRIDAVSAALTRLAGNSAPRDVTPSQASTSQRQQTILLWSASNTLYRLDSAYSRRREEGETKSRVVPEFLNLTMAPNRGRIPGDILGKDRVDVGYFALRDRIRRTPEGDIYLTGVPMVDQGQKGYCAVASTERVMRFYGVEVNQHELAQRAATASGGGTDPDSLLKALKSMANLLGVQVRLLDRGEDVEGFLDLLDDYNRAAERQGKKKITLDPQEHVIQLDRIYEQMDAAVFLKVRTRGSMAIERWTRAVRDQIGNGRPVLWSVVLGFVAETPELPQGRGGHLRLIIGYNAGKGEVLYTDSWGPGHELKRMKTADAYAITTGMFAIEPK